MRLPAMEVEKPGGHYVPREFSTRLKVYLKDQMGILVTPTVATRLVDGSERCEQPISEDGKLLPCASNSELEALMKLVKSLNGGTIPNLRFDAYLSVEQLGLVWDCQQGRRFHRSSDATSDPCNTAGINDLPV